MGSSLFYYLSLRGVTVGDTQLPFSASEFALKGDGSGGTIIDSGTAITTFPRVRVDAVLSGSGFDRASLWTGRGRSGPDRTEVASEPFFQDRTERSKARSARLDRTGPMAGTLFNSLGVLCWPLVCHNYIWIAFYLYFGHQNK